jgi:magnesium transporter
MHPTEAAAVIQRFPLVRGIELFDLVDDLEKKSRILVELGPKFLESYLEESQNIEKVALCLKEMANDDQADLLGSLPDDIRDSLLTTMSIKDREDLHDLLQHQEYTAGALMTTEVFKLSEELTVNQAIAELQNATEAETVFYIFVVNEFNHLRGVLSIRQLFQVPQGALLKEIMSRDVVRVRVDQEQEEVARLVAQYDLVAVPVIDEQNKLVGIITVDDVIDVIKEEAQETALKLGAAEAEFLEEKDFLASLRHRLPWFGVLFVGGIILSEIIVRCGPAFPQFVLLAGFIPLFLRISGIVSRQTSTIVLQSLAASPSDRSLLKRAVIHQSGLTILLAIMGSLVLVGYGRWRWPDETSWIIVSGVSLVVSMLGAVLLGLTLPWLIKRMKMDPMQTAGSFIPVFIDIIVLIVYFTLARWFLPVLDHV